MLAALNDVQPGEAQTLDLDGRTAALLAYQAAENNGLLIALPFKDDTVGLVDAYGPPAGLEARRDLILQIAASFDRPPQPAPVRLEQASAPWSQAVAELESSGLISSGGQLVFAERYVFASGRSLTQGLAESLSFDNVIMASTLVLKPGDTSGANTCAMMSRLGEAAAALEVGLDSGSHLYLKQGDKRSVLASKLNVSVPHRLLYLALADRLLVYLDGALVADRDIEIGGGYFGLRVQGGPGTRCEASDLWAFGVPDLTASATCKIVADAGPVNKRSGPGTGFAIAGILDQGASLAGTARTQGEDALTWWQLQDGTWVREDVVREIGACRALPVNN